jgi:quercetin dioxygenase-like cupin family protein
MEAFMLKPIKNTPSVTFIFLSLCLINPLTVIADASVSMSKELLFENNTTLKSNRIHAKMIRVTFPPLYKSPWHTHQGPGPRYILKGSLKITEGKQVNTYSAGEVFWESGKRMRAENLSNEEAELVLFELVPQ